MALSFTGQRSSVSWTQSCGTIDLESYSYSKSRQSIYGSCTDLLLCWYAWNLLLCVRKWTTFVFAGSQPSLLRQAMSLPDVANSDVVSVTRGLDLPWQSSSNAACPSVLKSLNTTLYWVFLLDTVIFSIIFSHASMKSIHAFSEDCTEWWKAHLPQPLCQIPQLGGKGEKGHSSHHIIWCLPSMPY